MHIKRYIIASLLYIAFIGWYISTFVSDGTTSVSIFGIVIPSLSNSAWVMLTLLFLVVGTVVHIVFYSVVGSLQLRKSEKDYDKIVESISDAYLGKENRKNIFRTPGYKMLGYLIDNSIVFPGTINSADIQDDKIRSTLEMIENIKNGKVVDLKKSNLSNDNALVIQNEKNRYYEGNTSAKDFLNHPDKYNKDLLIEIYADYVKTASVKDIENYKEFVSKEALYNVLARVNADENTIEISNDSLLSLFKVLDLSKQDYLDVAASMSCCMIPEQRMKLFETLSVENDDAMDSYLFTLFDLEMLEPASAILDISQPDEYLNFKAYLILRESNHHFNINLFV